MGASNFAYAEAVWTQTLPDFIGAHVSAFRATGGMPHLIVLSDLADPPSMPRAGPALFKGLTHGAEVFPRHARLATSGFDYRKGVIFVSSSPGLPDVEPGTRSLGR